MTSGYKSLSDLISGAGVRYVRNWSDIQVTGVAVDSRKVEKGFLFLAVQGEKTDGKAYVPDAVERGAAAVVADGEDFPRGPGFPDIPVVVVADGRLASSRIASAWHGRPADRLRMVGVTGTNGKTTITYLLRSIFEAAGFKVGLLGTIGYFIGDRCIPSSNTTPGPLDLHAMLAAMKAGGASHAVMEVSSHSLVQKRALDIGFDAAVFSNLRSDHMDFHRNSWDYLKAKGLLFRSVKSDGTSVLNADDWASVVYASDSSGRVEFYSRRQKADLTVTVKSASLSGTEASFDWKGRPFQVSIALPGMHNVENAAAAALAALSMGLDGTSVAAGIASLKLVPGRLEPVDTGLPISVFVDYAHTEDALRAVLDNLKGRFGGRIVTVFGCGGDRDRTKRPKMAAMVEKYSDFTIVTSDNPRTEDPMDIIGEIAAGFGTRERYVINPDRAAAIRSAVDMAEEGDVVLIAGKGHETYQEINGRRFPFDDRVIASEACRARKSSTRRGRMLMDWIGMAERHSGRAGAHAAS